MTHVPETDRDRLVRVLVIEDNVDTANSLALLLRLWGYGVHLAFDGRAGLSKALADPPHIILSDIGLPYLDGYSLARRVRQEPALDATILVAITAYAGDDARRRSLEAGFAFHLVKPVDPGDLKDVLDSVRESRVGLRRRTGRETMVLGLRRGIDATKVGVQGVCYT